MSSIDAANLFSCKGMVVVLTGGGGGIGRMMAKALSTNGAAKIYILGRRLPALEETAALCAPGVVEPLVCDVTSQPSLASCAAHVASKTGYVNLLIANSGAGGPQLHGLPENPSITELQTFLWDTPMTAWNETYAVNCTAAFYTAVAFLGLLDEGNKRGNVQQKSQVVATSSIGGFNRKVPAGFCYGSSKAATTLLMKQLATYLPPYGIRANVICPGIYPSEMSGPLFSGKDGYPDGPEAGTKEGAFPTWLIPAARAGSEEDMAGAILYLASRAGAYCNGNVVITDGGRLSMMPATY